MFTIYYFWFFSERMHKNDDYNMKAKAKAKSIIIYPKEKK